MAIIIDIERLMVRMKRFFKAKYPSSSLNFSESEILVLIHELEVYKMELRMLKEEIEQSGTEFKGIALKYEKVSEIHNRFVRDFIKQKNYSRDSELRA